LIRQKYQKRLENFFDFLGMASARVEDKCKSFLKRIKKEEEDNNNIHRSLTVY
jgi:hypothetical protein